MSRPAVLASFPVQDAKAYAGAFPTITQPKEVACFSRDADRTVYFDRRQLHTYRPATLPAPLDEAFESYRPKAATPGNPAPLADVLDALAHNSVAPQRGQIVTFRNNLNKLFATPYNRRDDWEIGVERGAPDGSVRLQVRETARQTAEEAKKHEAQRHPEYWGYRFEQLSTLTAEQAKALAAFRAIGGASSGGGGDGGSCDGYRVPSPSDPGSFDELYEADELPRVLARYGGQAGGSGGVSGASGGSRGGVAASPLGPVDANEEFCSINQLTIGKTKLLMAAEIDCKSDGTVGGLKAGSYIELKTTKVHRSARDVETFERHKQLKYWLQSFLAGVPTVVVGFRDDAGKVLELKTLETRSMHKGSIRDKGYWDAAACFNFGARVLEWLQEQLVQHGDTAGDCFVLRYEPAAAAIQLLAGGAGHRVADVADEEGEPGGGRKRARVE